MDEHKLKTDSIKSVPIMLTKRKRNPFLSDYTIVETSQTVTSKKARYQTLLRCLQSTTSCCLTLIMGLVHEKIRIMDIDAVRIRISQLLVSEEKYNLFYENLLGSFPDNNLPAVIQLLIATNISLSSLEEYISPPDEEGNYLKEPIFILYKFLLRLCDERPILVLVNDDTRGTNFSHVQENLENFVSEQIFMVSTFSCYTNTQGNKGQIGFGRGNRLTASTVTSKRARYQTLLRCLQSTTSCCLQIFMAILHKDKIIDDVEEMKLKLTSMTSNKDTFQFFETNLMEIFQQNNLSMIINVLIATNISLCSLQTYVLAPDSNSCYVKNPIYILYKFLLRTFYERPILVLGSDDSRGTFVAHIQECMEHFVAEQTYMQRIAFTLPAEVYEEEEEQSVKKEET